ncbi:unnamed protein product, partial [Sphacelaria rigidula]
PGHHPGSYTCYIYYALVYFGYSTPKASSRQTNELDNQQKPRQIRMLQITEKCHTPTLIHLSAPESTSVYAIPAQQIQAQKHIFRRDFYVLSSAPNPSQSTKTIT